MISAVDQSPYGAGTSDPRQTSWALFDASLLILILMLSSDMLVQLRFLQSPIWLLCYALMSLRIATVWPAFFRMLQRNWIVLLYPAICLTSVLWSVDKTATLAASLQLIMTMIMGLYLGWRYAISVLIKVLAVVLSIGVGLSILHWATGLFPWPVYTRTGGLAGLFSSKSMLGLRALFAITAIVAILMMPRHDVGSTFRKLATVALLANIFALSVSLSMTSVLLLPVMVTGLLMLCWHRVPPILFSAGLLILLAALSVGPVMLVIAGVNPVEAVLGAVGKSTTLTGRVYIWDVAVDVYRDNPMLGVGYQAFWQSPHFLNEQMMTQKAGALTSTSFHSFPLEILVSAGWPALLAMLALLWVTAGRLLVLFRYTRSAAVAGAISLIGGVVLSSLIGTTLYRAHEIMIILVVAFAVSAGEDLYRMRRQAETGAAPR